VPGLAVEFSKNFFFKFRILKKYFIKIGAYKGGGKIWIVNSKYLASRWSDILFYWAWYSFYEIEGYWKFTSILFYCNFSFWNYLLCKVWTVNWEHLASWISGKRRTSLRYFKGTQSHTVQPPSNCLLKYYFISPSNKTLWKLKREN